MLLRHAHCWGLDQMDEPMKANLQRMLSPEDFAALMQSNAPDPPTELTEDEKMARLFEESRKKLKLAEQQKEIAENQKKKEQAERETEQIHREMRQGKRERMRKLGRIVAKQEPIQEEQAVEEAIFQQKPEAQEEHLEAEDIELLVIEIKVGIHPRNPRLSSSRRRRKLRRKTPTK